MVGNIIGAYVLLLKDGENTASVDGDTIYQLRDR